MPQPSRLTNALIGGKALVVFVTAGDPTIEDLPEIIGALVEGGADVIEIGLPFSDPIADGPVIQASSQRALDSGVTTERIFSTLSMTDRSVPLVLMGYTNPALRIGLKVFADKAVAAGIDGVIISDLIPEEAENWVDSARNSGLDTVFLAAPTSTDERIRRVAELSSGFIYCVSRTGVTGADNTTSDAVFSTVARIRKYSDLPVCVGFGISTPEQVRQVCDYANGAVVGSYIVKVVSEKWHSGKGRGELVDAVRTLKARL